MSRAQNMGLYQISALQGAAADDFANSTATNGSLINNGSPRSGTIETVHDEDAFRVSLQSGQTYVFSLTRLSASGLDPVLTLRNSNFNVLSINDDFDGTLSQSKITFTASATGTYYISASGFSTSTGSYQIAVGSGAFYSPASIPGATITGTALGDTITPEAALQGSHCLPPTATLSRALGATTLLMAASASTR